MDGVSLWLSRSKSKVVIVMMCLPEDFSNESWIDLSSWFLFWSMWVDVAMERDPLDISFSSPNAFSLCRTNSDSALHTSVMNPPAGDPFSAGHTLTPQGRLTGEDSLNTKPTAYVFSQQIGVGVEGLPLR